MSNSPELSFHYIRLSQSELARLDTIKARIRSDSRADTFRKMVCAFGKKYKIEVPPDPLPEPNNVVRTNEVGIMIPRAVNSWLDNLVKASNSTSFRQVFRRALKEFAR